MGIALSLRTHLFTFHVVGDLSLLVDSSAMHSHSCSRATPARDQHQLNIDSIFHLEVALREVTHDQRLNPMIGEMSLLPRKTSSSGEQRSKCYFSLRDEIGEHSTIPEESLVRAFPQRQTRLVARRALKAVRQVVGRTGVKTLRLFVPQAEFLWKKISPRTLSSHSVSFTSMHFISYLFVFVAS